MDGGAVYHYNSVRVDKDACGQSESSSGNGVGSPEGEWNIYLATRDRIFLVVVCLSLGNRRPSFRRTPTASATSCKKAHRDCMDRRAPRAVVSFDCESAVSPHLVRKRCGVCRRATSKAERIGPMKGIWRGNFTAGCLWLSATKSRRASRCRGRSRSSCW
jgi:hypothetical protein